MECNWVQQPHSRAGAMSKGSWSIQNELFSFYIIWEYFVLLVIYFILFYFLIYHGFLLLLLLFLKREKEYEVGWAGMRDLSVRSRGRGKKENLWFFKIKIKKTKMSNVSLHIESIIQCICNVSTAFDMYYKQQYFVVHRHNITCFINI